MNVLIVYDSVFGNTEQIARAIGDTIGTKESVQTLRVNSVKTENIRGVDLLIVGSPTRGFRPTEAIQTFLKALDQTDLKSVRVATFDTRIMLSDIKSPFFRFIVNTGGYAANVIGRHLKKLGGYLLVPPEGFFVSGQEGPLKDGELERAGNWALQLITHS